MQLISQIGENRVVVILKEQKPVEFSAMDGKENRHYSINQSVY